MKQKSTKELLDELAIANRKLKNAEHRYAVLL
jgi:hypothetical protein